MPDPNKLLMDVLGIRQPNVVSVDVRLRVGSPPQILVTSVVCATVQGEALGQVTQHFELVPKKMGATDDE